MGYLNGQIMNNGQAYHRMYDFNRDAWYQLTDKLVSKTWNKKSRRKHLPIIYDKILSRIENGSCSKDEILNLLKYKLRSAQHAGDKKLKKEIKYYITEISKYKLNSKSKKLKSKDAKVIKTNEYNIIIKDSNVFINGDKIKLKKNKALKLLLM